MSHAIAQHNAHAGDPIREVIVHTGQHFDENMSQVFFDELAIPPPHHHLGIAGLTHGAMTGRMLERIEQVLLEEVPDWVVVFGDTNSTLAAALADWREQTRLLIGAAGSSVFVIAVMLFLIVRQMSRQHQSSRQRLMLEKVTGTVAYVVIKTGGLLGTHHHYPMPWSGLKFDPARQAFEAALTMDELQAGPCEFDDDTFDWGERSRSYPHANYWTV